MKTSTALTLLLLAAAGRLPAAELVSDSPAAGADGVIVVKSNALQQIRFQPVPVKGGDCYRLVFEARAAGAPLIGNNPRVHVARFENRSLFWRWEIAQHDATNAAAGHVAATHMSVFSDEWRTYQDLFRASRQAVGATLTFEPPAVPVGLEIRHARLEPHDSGDAVNLNGDFSLGDDCLAGWGSPFASAGFRMIKGRRVYDTAYGSESVGFPLDDRLAYRVTVKRTTYGGYDAANLYLMNGGRNLKMVTVPQRGTLDFVPPPGTTWGYFKIYNTYLESARMTPLGPKETLRN